MKLFQKLFAKKVALQEAEIIAGYARLELIVRRIADQIGDAPLAYDENGDLYLHPELRSELLKPENDDLRPLVATVALVASKFDPKKEAVE